MKSKRKLNCYVFCNLIVSILTLNVLTNPTSKELVKKDSNNTLKEIYEREIESVSIPDSIITSNEVQNNIQRIGNDNSNNQKVYNYQKPSYNSLTGTNLVNYAMQFIGLRYVSAGNSLATGTDCSGFTSLIYKEFGISLGRTVSSQIYSGTYVSRDDLQPGDLVFYSYGTVASHVAIYIGNGLIIHESTPRDGVKISSVNIMRYITARRLITANVGVTSNAIETKQEVVEQTIETNNAVNEVNNNSIVEETKEVIKDEGVKTEENKEKIEEESTTEEKSNRVSRRGSRNNKSRDEIEEK